jgi:hypothetical protein
MKNSKGLKGVTDAMSHCKSMYAKGGSASTTHMLRTAASYAMGGSTEDCTNDPGKPRRCGKTKKIRTSGKTQSWFGNPMPGQ